MSEHQVDETDAPTPPAPVLERHRQQAVDLLGFRRSPAHVAAIARALADAEADAYVRGYNAGHEVGTDQGRGGALRAAADLISDARCGITDPGLRSTWGRQRRQLLDEAIEAGWRQ